MWVSNSFGSNVWVPNSPSTELTIFQQVFVSTFGANTNLVPSSINGVFIQELTNFGVQNENTVTLLTSQIYNPNYASGQYLDGLCAWDGIRRASATQSVVTCQLAGLPLVTIPAETQVISIYGDVFYSQAEIIFNSGGIGSGVFLSLDAGAINCDANAINRILQPISGWDTINNSAPGVQGTIQQSDSSLRFERQYNLGVNSTGSVISLNSALGNAADIVDFIVINNDSGSPLTSRGVTVPAGGIYISVYGSASNATIGNLIANKNSSGTQIYATAPVTYTYTNPTYGFTITTRWDVPNACPIQVDISYVNNPALPTDIPTQIQNLIINNFNNGSANFPPVNMRVPFYITQLTAGIEALGVVILTQTMQTVTAGSPTNTLFLNVVGAAGLTGKPTISIANINLTAV
jgi:hypothetical protein